jgi:spore coat protein U-like protein
MKRLLLGMTCLGLAAAALPASAQTADTTMSVNTTVTKTCTISAADLAFAGYSQTANTDTTSTVTVQCTGTSGTLNFKVGDGGNLSGGSRRMTDGVNFINYQVATTAGGTDLVNIDDVATSVDAGTGAGTVTLHGRIPSGQGNKPAGTYSDTVTLTLTY